MVCYFMEFVQNRCFRLHDHHIVSFDVAKRILIMIVTGWLRTKYWNLAFNYEKKQKVQWSILTRNYDARVVKVRWGPWSYPKGKLPFCTVFFCGICCDYSQYFFSFFVMRQRQSGRSLNITTSTCFFHSVMTLS